MNLKFHYPGAAYSVDSILEFVSESQTNFWSGPFFYFFPDIRQEQLFSLEQKQRRSFLMEYMEAFAAKNRQLLADKQEQYQQWWEECRPQVVGALQETFSLDLTDLFEDMEARITWNPISPRYLKEQAFDVFYLNSEKGAVGIALHEIIHFVWFYVWNRHFGDDWEEYEAPHLKWLLSEMAVEPIMRDRRLASVNPYFASKSCVYPYFYTLELEGRPALDLLYEMLQEGPMERFMERSYRLLQEHETAIRGHVAKNEVEWRG